jgi:heme oxygenase
MADYHRLLLMIFHQTFNGPGFLAIAGANCTAAQQAARDYLIKHADEERTHWTWVVNDLRNTGYDGPDPRNRFPPEPCQAYISFNFHVAHRMPLARLAIAVMLESLGATHGKSYALKTCQVLGLHKDQATFFMGHSDTDVGHTEEIWKVLEQCNLADTDWEYMAFAAETAFRMYYRMYEEILE